MQVLHYIMQFTSSSDSSPARLVKSMFALRHTMCEYRRPTPCPQKCTIQSYNG